MSTGSRRVRPAHRVPTLLVCGITERAGGHSDGPERVEDGQDSDQAVSHKLPIHGGTLGHMAKANRSDLPEIVGGAKQCLLLARLHPLDRQPVYTLGGAGRTLSRRAYRTCPGD